MNCRGRLVYDTSKPEGEKITTTNEHSHAPDATVVGVAKAVDSMKRRAKESAESPRNIIASVCKDMDEATAAAMSSTSAQGRRIKRARIDDFPAMPATRAELIIPERFTRSKNEQFLLYDSGCVDDRILMFATERNLFYLKRCQIMFMDGTFFVVPPLFSQMYSLQGKIDGWNVPLVYILAPNKTKKTYERVFQVLHEKCDGWAPDHIMSDFELGAINAAKSVFKSSIFHVCLFHFGQSIYSKIQEVGLKKRYSDEPMFALNLRKLIALAFVPASDIPDAFSQLCETEFFQPDEDDEDSPKLEAILNYFETTYIGIATRTQGRRRNAMFSPDLWSVYELVKAGKIVYKIYDLFYILFAFSPIIFGSFFYFRFFAGLPRTNNSIEAWHGQLNKSFGAGHLSFFRFVMALVGEQAFQEIRLAKIERGDDPEVTPLKYRKLNKRIKKIVDSYEKSDEFDVVHYLTSLAHNIHL